MSWCFEETAPQGKRLRVLAGVLSLMLICLLAVASAQETVVIDRTFSAASKTEASGSFRVVALDRGVVENQGVLELLGVPHDYLTPEAFQTANLSEYDAVFIGTDVGSSSEGTQALYDRSADIAAFVNAGGGLVVLSQYAGGWSWVPSGATVSTYEAHTDCVRLVNPWHPVNRKLDHDALSGWVNAVHSPFQSYPSIMSAIANDCAGHAVTLVGSLGAGKIVYSVQDPDHHAVNSDNSDSLQYVRNMLKWVTNSFPVTSQVPVLIVPGIMGSMSSCLFDADCPEDYHWNPLGPVDLTLGRKWVLDPIEYDYNLIHRSPTYASLVQTFLDNGYTLNKTLFTVPYDWRRHNAANAKQTLASVIEKAKGVSGHDRVDVVAHSMGGLLTRYYVEALDRKDLRKFVMLGTPHAGSAQAYYLWEGGDFSVYPFYERLCFFDPLIEQMKVAAGYEDKTNGEFIRDRVLAVRELLPTRDYLFDSDFPDFTIIPVNEMIWQNKFIPSLRYITLVKNIPLENIRIFAGNGVSTRRYVGVTDHTGSGTDFLDGSPTVYSAVKSGDGTVLAGSAKLGKIRVDSIAGGKHGELPDLCRQEVQAFLSGSTAVAAGGQETAGLKRAETGTISAPSSLLFAGTRSDVHLGLTTPGRLSVGCFPGATECVADLDNFYYGGTIRKTGALGVYDPIPGNYLLTVSTEGPPAAYEVYISYSREESGKQKTKIRGMIEAGATAVHHIEIGSGLKAW